MSIKFKITPNSPKNQWICWLDDNVIKVKLVGDRAEKVKNLTSFITENLGIRPKDMKIITSEKLVEIEFPEIAWELFLSTKER